ncbi:MAG TPA: hypothetical protein VEJ63_23260 [Planctomycetota bacterium]|nr:hypothetical protein [Planctomycetota bacterium]
MSNKPRTFWQVHLSTLMLASFAAVGVLAFNTVKQHGVIIDDPDSWLSTRAVEYWTFEERERIRQSRTISKLGTFFHWGWPFIAAAQHEDGGIHPYWRGAFAEFGSRWRLRDSCHDCERIPHSAQGKADRLSIGLEPREDSNVARQ